MFFGVGGHAVNVCGVWGMVQEMVIDAVGDIVYVG
jgi:hypothetical protein